MATTKTYATKTEHIYTFRYEEELEGEHGRKHIHSPSFHAILTLPNGQLKINQYGYKENNHIEISAEDIERLASILAAASETYREEKMRRMRGEV